jgi:DNA-binding NarL/FixJ family response regulator
MDMRCLIVDDNASFLRAMRYMLERDGADVVGSASNGNEALERAMRLRPDIMLIDVRLGGESGFDVAHRVEESAAHAGWRPAIVLVSTHAVDELAERMAANPSLGFLDKTTVSAQKVREAVAVR